MFDLRLRRAHHIRRYFIHEISPAGWEVRLEEDSELRRVSVYQDWHRVERALTLFELEVAQLLASGWLIADATS